MRDQTDSPGSSPVFEVPRDGDLASVLERVPDCGTVLLSAGEHPIAQPLLIRKSVTVIGCGPTRCKITCSEAESVMTFCGAGSLRLEELALQHSGDRPADVLRLTSGTSRIERCSFRGGAAAEGEMSIDGAALNCFEDATVAIVASDFADSEYGIVLGGDVRATLDNCSCRDNRKSGLALFRRAGGSVSQGRFLNNGVDGVTVCGESRLAMDAGLMTNNGRAGLAFVARASGEARGCLTRENGQFGIYVAEEAKPTLVGGISERNKVVGIAYKGKSGGVASGCLCRANEKHGVSVSDRARPTLENVTCEENKRSGIVYSDDSGGTARRCLSRENEGDGIAVSDRPPCQYG